MLPEVDLQAAIAEDLRARGLTVRREVTAWWADPRDGGDIKGRIDLYAKAPPSWPHYGRFPLIAIEVKRREEGDMGSLIDGMFQTWGAMFALRFRHEQTDLPRPSIALYVDAATWFSPPKDEDRETMLADRLLWRQGASILRGATPWAQPRFVFAGPSQPQTVFNFPARIDR